MSAAEGAGTRPALFISDLHLCEERPATTRAFFAFLDGPAREAAALYILGDLFEYWAGDDDDAPLNQRVAEGLRTLANNGTAVYFMAGNRDFLIGERFADSAALTLLPDPARIDLGIEPLLLSHGDALCTDDDAYQRYREQVRAPDWQHAFLSRPLAERRAIIEGIRRESERSKREKSMEIMDVNPSAVAALFRTHGYATLIHGHTHRPACHITNVDGQTCTRWVLSDWHDDAPYLEWRAGSGTARRFTPPA